MRPLICLGSLWLTVLLTACGIATPRELTATCSSEAVPSLDGGVVLSPTWQSGTSTSSTLEPITPSLTISPLSLRLRALLPELPLDPGNTWVYSATYYEGDGEAFISATYIITDTVVATWGTSSYFVAEMERTKAWAAGMPADQLRVEHAMPLSTHYRHYGYVFVPEVDAVYWMRPPEFSHAERRGFLRYKLPLASQKRCWYNLPGAPTLSPEARACSGWGYRYVEGPGEVTVPAGTFCACYQVAQVYRGVGAREWLCPGVGIVRVARKFTGDLYQPATKYEQVLLHYLVRGP